MTREQVRYAAVLLNGPQKALTKFAIALRKVNFQVGRPNASVLCVDDVSEEELQHIVAEADVLGCYVESTRGTHFVEVEPVVKKAEKTSIEAGTWYYAEKMVDSYPFVYVKKKEAMDTMGLSPEQVVVLQLELLDGNGSTPKKLQADARKMDDFGLRLATEEDFDQFDLPIPAELRIQMQRNREDREASTGPNLQHIANFGGTE